MRDGVYYVAASNTCGYCNGSIGFLYRSSSIQGPWTRQIVAGYSCYGQVEGVLPLKDPGTGDITDLWHSTSVPGGPRTGFDGHIFQPLHFCADGSVEDLDCSPDASFNMDFQPGVEQWQAAPLRQLGKRRHSMLCGTLTSVSVNIARSVQSIPLAITVFKFASYAELIAPEYKWTTLGTAILNCTSLSYVLNTTSIPITTNTAVSAGDLLGLAFSGQDFARYCHLEYETAANSTIRLYQRGAGQNSWAGLQGRTSMVYERVGRIVKIFVNYA